MYKVVKLFNDLKDNEHLYNVGDTYPRDGLEVEETRVKELLCEANLQGTPLIEEVEEIKKPSSKKETSKEAK